jgi:transmembrane sensor
MQTKDMDSNDNNLEYYNELITSHFCSVLSKEEEDALRHWIQKDKTNLHYFEECREVWLSSKLSAAQKEFSSKDAFQRFKKITGNIKDEITIIVSQTQNTNVNMDPSSDHNKKLFTEETNKDNFLFRRMSLSLTRIAAIFVLAYLLGVVTYTIFFKNSSSSLTFQEIIVPAGSKTRINLPDGTIVWLNSESKLTYTNSYNIDKREVRLEGEGYFKVSEDKKRPFIVLTSNISVRALGTEFNVKCYPGEGFIETTLVKGSVKIKGNSDNNGIKTESLILKPNEKLTFIKKSGKLYSNIDSFQNQPKQSIKDSYTGIPNEVRKEQIFIQTIDPSPYIAWKEDKLIFTGERFEEIKARLERWYGVSIQIKDPEILTYRFKGSFEKESLEQALEALKLASHFSYSINKNKIIIGK